MMATITKIFRKEETPSHATGALRTDDQSAREAAFHATPKGMDVKERLGKVKYDVDGRFAHITVDAKICEKCPHHFCVMACPAQCYTLSKEGKLVFQYEDCVECGACSIACDQGSVTWHYPKAGKGVIYKFG